MYSIFNLTIKYHLNLSRKDWLSRTGYSPDWCDSVGWASSHKVKGHPFDSCLEHLPGMQAQCPRLGSMWEATSWCFSHMTMFLTLFFSLSSLFSKIKKHVLALLKKASENCKQSGTHLPTAVCHSLIYPSLASISSSPLQLPDSKSRNDFFFVLRFYLFIYLFLERGEGKEKERERNINVWLPLACWGPGPHNPGMCLEIKLATLWFAGPCSIHWATLASVGMIFSILTPSYSLDTSKRCD